MPQMTLLIKPVSDACNMRCRYCFYADVAKRRGIAASGAMTPQTREALVRKALNFAEGYCSFGFQGGEPTLAGLEFFDEFVALEREYNHNNVQISNSIQTNGYGLGREWAEFFSRNKFLVGLSMDGTKNAHDSYRVGADGLGTFDAVVATAELFAEYNVDFNILCVVNDEVASRPGQVYAALRKYKFLQFIPCIDDFDATSPPEHSLAPAKYAKFLKSTFDSYYSDFMRGEYVSIRNFDNYLGILLGNPPEQCGMSGVCTCYFLVEADGNVYPCDFYVLEKWKIGNVGENSFARMIKSETAMEFVDTSRHVHEECRPCEWRGLCRGGCRRYREPLVDGVLSKNKLCAAYAEFFSYAYERMQQMATKLRTP
ncbi:MAG: anaerobic sulfatase maturase [Oscillospiraceae bacterium]|nr:anaerobic sulfatase maturase [Oscillospiraceae bacterium]